MYYGAELIGAIDMKRVLLTVAILALSGCATYSDLRERPADFSAETSKTPQEYAACVLPKWIDFSAGTHVIADGDARVVVSPVGGGTPTAVLMTLTASPNASGSRVEMKHMSSLSKFSEQWQAAQSCT